MTPKTSAVIEFPMTPDQVKQRFRDQGETISGWARRHGFPPHSVYRLLSGYDQGNYGRSHRIAVALGLKPTPPTKRAA